MADFPKCSACYWIESTEDPLCASGAECEQTENCGWVDCEAITDVNDEACDTDAFCDTHEKCDVCYWVEDTTDVLCTGEC